MEGERKRVTVLFADVAGFTSISVRWDQRMAALANSLPISPRPMIPNLTVSMLFLHFSDGLLDYRKTHFRVFLVHYEGW